MPAISLPLGWSILPPDPPSSAALDCSDRPEMDHDRSRSGLCASIMQVCAKTDARRPYRYLSRHHPMPRHPAYGARSGAKSITPSLAPPLPKTKRLISHFLSSRTSLLLNNPKPFNCPNPQIPRNKLRTPFPNYNQSITLPSVITQSSRRFPISSTHRTIRSQEPVALPPQGHRTRRLPDKRTRSKLIHTAQL